MFELMQHQKDEVAASQKMSDRYLAWDVGCGKTAAVICSLKDKYRSHDALLPTLILAPLATLQNWKREFAIWAKDEVFQQNILVLQGPINRRVSQIEHVKRVHGGRAVLITNYEAINSDELFEALDEFAPLCMVFDEAHLLKNPQAKRSKKAYHLSANADYRWCLSGTPVLRSTMDLYQQYKVLDGSLGDEATFPEPFYVWRRRYFEDANQYFAGKPGYFPKWQPRIEMHEDLRIRIMQKTSVVNKNAVLKDLPPLVVKDMHVDMTKDQKKVYKSLRNEFIVWMDKQHKLLQGPEGASRAVVARMAITRLLRFQQIASGFYVSGEGDDSETCDFPTNPKLDLTQQLLTQITPNHKVIIWCCFKRNYEVLSQLCESLGLGYVCLTGEQTTNEKYKNQDLFNNNDSVRVLIGNPTSGGIGINLISASYMIYFSRNFSLGADIQSEGRNYRKGSEVHEKITRINIIANDSIDDMLARSLQQKKEIGEEILEWVV